MEREQARHHRERGPDEHRPRVAAPGADGAQADGGRGRDERAEADRVDVGVAREGHPVPAEDDVERRGSGRRQPTSQRYQYLSPPQHLVPFGTKRPEP